MLKKGVVAIVGRPNVGKSSLFNRIIKQKKSIVDDMPGVTRDRIYANAEWLTREFIVIDTGGITLDDSELFSKEIKIQAEIAMSEADVIVFLLDFKNGITLEDKSIAKMLYKTEKPVILAVNKYDKKTDDNEIYEYLSLGFDEPVMISSSHGIGIGDLLDKIIYKMPKIELNVEENNTKITIIGKPNVGKSSLINSILGQDRMIVSEIAGTTLDAVDSIVNYNKKKYTFIDTAGIRKKSRIYKTVERYSYLRSLSTISDSNIILFMLDISQPITDLDVNIAGLAFEEKKPIIIICNKWDLIKNKEKEILLKEKEIRNEFKYLAYAKIMFVSSIDKTRIYKIFDAIEVINNKLKAKIKTHTFNEILNRAQLLNPAPDFNGGRLKIYYASQVNANIPTFILFVNNPKFLHFSYKRYLENQIRAQFNFDGIPINLIFREKKYSFEK